MKRIIVALFLLSTSIARADITYSVEPEFGIGFFDTQALDIAPSAKYYVNTLKGLGWSNASESHINHVDNFYGGVVFRQNYKKFNLGIGYRYFDLGNSNVEVNANSGLYNWTQIYDEQWAAANNIYLTAGFLKYINSSKIKFAFNGEVGITSAEIHDKARWDGYNGSSFAYYNTSSIHSDGYWYALLVSTQYSFTPRFSVISAGGYKINNFETFKYDAVDSNIYTNKVGDTAKDVNGKYFNMDLSGPIFNIKIAWMF